MKIKDITVKFHIDNNMKIDNEVPLKVKQFILILI